MRITAIFGDCLPGLLHMNIYAILHGLVNCHGAAVYALAGINNVVKLPFKARGKKILIVDGERAWADGLSDYLKARGYSTFSIARSLGALQAAQNYHPDCIILDFNMPDAKADLICREIRSDKEFNHLPIIIVSTDPNKEIDSYMKCRADNFIIKSYDFLRITSAIESLMRRISWSRSSIERGDLCLDSRNQTLYRNSRPLFRLSPEQFQLLFLLLQKEGSFVNEKIISEELYDHNGPPDPYDAIKMLVYRLRSKLGSQLGRRIKNKRNQGWIYINPPDLQKKSLPEK